MAVYLRTCPVCGRQFEAEGSAARARKYCSRECSRRGAARRRTGKCPVCGRKFVLAFGAMGGAACSEECLARMDGEALACRLQEMERRRKELSSPAGVCALCGKPFASAHGSRYCSEECRLLARKRQGRESRRKRQGVRRADPLGDPRPPLCRFCGKARTWDYRCPECLKAWKRKWHVTGSIGGEEEE